MTSNACTVAYYTCRPLLCEVEALQIYTCADRVYVINCNG